MMSEEQSKITNSDTKKNGGQGRSLMPTIIIALSVIISCSILTGGFLAYKSTAGHSISATGSASVNFESDLVVWRGSFTAYDQTSQAAYDKIKSDAAVVKKYLEDNGLTEDEIVFNSVDISQRTEDSYDDYGNIIASIPNGYDLTQGIVITSTNLDTVDKISRDISSLLDSGVEFTSNSPEYYCTSLDDVKLDLIDKATQNARARIDIMAKEADANVDKLASSDLGVFQITAQNSGTSDYSYDGYFDTSSREKTASITVRLEYTLK